MIVNNAMNSALAGIRAGQALANKSAQNLAKLGTDQPMEEDMTTSLINLKVARNQVEVSAKTARTVSDTLDSLLKILG